MRAFVMIRQYALTYSELAGKIKELEQKYDKQFADVYEAMDFLIGEKQKQIDFEKRKKIGFKKE